MAKIYHEKAYIEAHSDDEDNFSIELHCNNILVGKSPVTPVKWLWTDINEDGDLIINNSAGMEGSKWDYITREIIANG